MPDKHLRTEISFSNDLPLPAYERRTDERSSVSVYRTATIRWNGVEGLCLIRNLSAGGMMGRVPAEIPINAAVSVEICEGRAIEGVVVWTDAPYFGVRFAERIDVLDVLHARTTGADGLLQRMPRLRVPCRASLRIGDDRQQVTLVDVSQGGAKIEVSFVRPGDEVVLAIPGLDPRRGTIRWTREGLAGIAFFASIPFQRLAEWALAQQAEVHAEPPPGTISRPSKNMVHAAAG